MSVSEAYAAVVEKRVAAMSSRAPVARDLPWWAKWGSVILLSRDGNNHCIPRPCDVVLCASIDCLDYRMRVVPLIVQIAAELHVVGQ